MQHIKAMKSQVSLEVIPKPFGCYKRVSFLQMLQALP